MKKIFLALFSLVIVAAIGAVAVIFLLDEVEDLDSENESNIAGYELDENGCFDFEEYDEEFDECYAECETDEQCEEIDALYDEIFSEEFDDSEWEEFLGDDDFGYSAEGEYASEDEIAGYTVSNGELDPESGDTVVSSHEMLWSEFEKLFENSPLFSSIERFAVFSDGQDGTLAYVGNIDDDYEVWELAIDLEDYYSDGNLQNEKDLQATLIHEYAHIMTLHAGQLDESSSSCNTYNPGEGCLEDSSYLYSFYDEFWKGEIADAYATVENSCDLESGEECDELDNFYFKFEDNFVSDYAATNPAEDIAESFANYVLITDLSSFTPEVQEKLNFFSEYPELVSLRRDVRSGLVR